MKFIVEIDTENDAFADDAGYEVGRILEHLAGIVGEAGALSDAEVALFDINGHRVGRSYVKAGS